MIIWGNKELPVSLFDVHLMTCSIEQCTQVRVLLHQLGAVSHGQRQVFARGHRPQPVHARDLLLREVKRQQTAPLRMERR